MEADRRRSACDRLRHSLPYHAVQHPRKAVGYRAAGSAGRSEGDTAAGAGMCRRLRHDAAALHRRRVYPHLRTDCGSAVRAVRAELFYPRQRQGHIRHRLLYADERRKGTSDLSQRAADLYCMAAAGRDDLCVGRRYLCSGRRHSMAEKPDGADPLRGGHGGHGAADAG